ncbi:MAG: trigger factor [Sumerlaeia bacterium]
MTDQQETHESALSTVLEKKNERIAYQVDEGEGRPGSRVRYAVKVAEEDFAPKVDEVLEDFRKHAAIPGFRPGKAPVKLVRNRYAKAARDEAAKRLAPKLAEQLTEDKKLEVLADPGYEGSSSTPGEGVELYLILEVRPEIKVTDETLKDLKVEVTEEPVTDEKVAAEIEALREKNAVFEAQGDDAVFAKDDALTLDMVVVGEGGEPHAHGGIANEYIEDVKQMLPAEVADALAGKKKGDIFDVEDVGHGDHSHTYRVTVGEIKKRVLPELDDEFAKDISDEHETLEDLRKSIREDLEKQEENRKRAQILQGLFSLLNERVDFETPASLVNQLANRNLSRTEQQMRQYGLTLKSFGKERLDTFISNALAESAEQVKTFLILDQIGRNLGIEASEEKIAEEIEKIAEYQGRKPLAIRAQLEANKQFDDFVQDIRLRAVQDRLAEMAETVVVEAKADEDEAAGASGETPQEGE